MTTSYVFSQIAVILAMLCLCVTYFVKSKNKILIFTILSALFYAAQYFLLGAMTGLGVSVIKVVMTIWFAINTKVNKKNSAFSLICLNLMIIVVGIITWDSAMSLIPLAATSLLVFSIWIDNIKVYRFSQIPISISYIFYAISYASIFGITTEAILLVAEIISVTLLFKKYTSPAQYASPVLHNKHSHIKGKHAIVK